MIIYEKSQVKCGNRSSQSNEHLKLLKNSAGKTFKDEPGIKPF